MTILDKWFNERYFRTKHFEQDGKIYEYMGIRIYKRIIMYQVRKKKVGNYNLMSYSLNGIRDFERESRCNEKVHTILAILILLLVLLMGFFIKDISSILRILSMLLINILINFYPICLQRYNRIRITRILDKFEFQNKNKL